MKNPDEAKAVIPAAAKKLMNEGIPQRKAINLAGLGKGPSGKSKKG